MAAACGLPTAQVELLTIAGRSCLVVRRFDRTHDAAPVGRLHQEDLCQAIGISSSFKYATPGRPRPSFEDIGTVLADHGSRPGVDRLAAARMTTFNFLIGNADAHGKNVSFLHDGHGSIRLAPLYDLVCTAAWPDLTTTMSMAIDDAFDPAMVGPAQLDDLAADFGLSTSGFRRQRTQLTTAVAARATELAEEAHQAGWHHEVIHQILATIAARVEQAS